MFCSSVHANIKYVGVLEERNSAIMRLGNFNIHCILSTPIGKH